MNRREAIRASVIMAGMGALYLAGCRDDSKKTGEGEVKQKETPETERTATETATQTAATVIPYLPTKTEEVLEATPTVEVKQRPEKVLSVYINLDDVNNERKVVEMLGKMGTWGANSVVVEIKNDAGNINVPFEHRLRPNIGNWDRNVENLSFFKEGAEQLGIHLIARQVVMMDKTMLREHPELGIGIADYTVPFWFDPRNDEVVEYTAAVSRAAVDFGFREIQLDYVRFPNANVRYYLDHDERTGAICKILSVVRQVLNEEALLTADFFGGTPTTPESLPDMGIGQNIARSAKFLDGICPMLYPDVHGTHAAVDEYGYVLEGTMKTIEKLREGGNPEAFVNPWIQAYEEGLRAIRDQERAAFDGGAVGVHAWNNALVYPDGFYKEG